MSNSNSYYLETAEEKLYKLSQTSSREGIEANERFISPLDGNKKKSESLKQRKTKTL